MSTAAVQDPGAVRRGIEETNRRFEEAFNRGDAAGAAQEVYTRGARILPPGADAVQGRDAIAQFWTAAAAQLGVTRVRLETRDLQVAGDRAFEIGRAHLTFGNGGEATAKYVVIWKQEEGRWRWDVDIWNMDAA